MSDSWKPDHAVQIVAGTPPGGGLDRVARALEKAIAQSQLIDVPVEVLNVPGDGARRAWTHCVDQHPGDGHVVSISSPNLVSDFLVGIADFEHSRYTPIATLVTEYIAFAVRADDATLPDGKALLARLGDDAAAVKIALSTALGNPNHVALAKLIKHAGGEVDAPVIRVFDTALDAVADVVAGKADVCAVTAASVLAELKAGRVRVLAISAPARLSGAFAETPTWSELGADCVIGAWRGVTGPVGLSPAQIAYWERVVTAAAAQPVWQEELARLNWSPLLATGPALDAYLDTERAEFVTVLDELGLLKP
ncbi:MAG: tripartite tricarboxylate transporter substrate-binding protein [Beijerinckiaceae bacterium]|nr:tripartite tricarboxylate transporter substrate-binding protein [Beijerinckiaceae bacterium]